MYKSALAIALACLSVLALPSFAAPPLASPQVSKNLKTVPLNKIAMLTMQNQFADAPKNLSSLVKEFDVPPQYRKSKGLFVTIFEGEKTRACWGSVSPRYSDLVSATVYTTVDALGKEYRYPPIKAKELPSLKAQVTIVEALVPVSQGSGATLHPLTDGLMVRSGGKGAVLLPGEASSPQYQVMQCKLKAGINPKEACQIYVLKAHVIR
ncbi:MAG: AMMECR1 domain-containing protein [Candidatus Melainabacteria bacterium]|nr:AMMECR1 domain-containing protein [Candidatus Melainabacteria bacterium]